MRLYHQFNGQSFQLKDGGGRSEISLLSYPGKGLGVGFQLQAERHSSLLLLNFTSHFDPRITAWGTRGEETISLSG